MACGCRGSTGGLWGLAAVPGGRAGGHAAGSGLPLLRLPRWGAAGRPQRTPPSPGAPAARWVGGPVWQAFPAAASWPGAARRRGRPSAVALAGWHQARSVPVRLTSPPPLSPAESLLLRAGLPEAALEGAAARWRRWLSAAGCAGCPAAWLCWPPGCPAVLATWLPGCPPARLPACPAGPLRAARRRAPPRPPPRRSTGPSARRQQARSCASSTRRQTPG
jgi:hypothetical protein